jgi:phosphonate transport system ATP-binding protein
VASLDPKSARLVLGDLKRVSRELGIAVLCNLHQVGYAMEFADRIVGIHAGQVVFEGAPDALGDEALGRIYPGLSGKTQIEAAAETALPLTEQPS